MNINYKNNKNTLFIVFAGILFYVGLQNISGIMGSINWVMGLFFPFLLGGAIAFIFNVPMKHIETRLYEKIFRLKSPGMKRILSYLTTLIAVVVVLLLVILVVVPEVISTCNTLIKQAPNAFDSTKHYFENLNAQWPQLSQLADQKIIDLDTLSQNAINLLQTRGMMFLNSTFGIVGGFLSGIVTFFIAFTFSIYILFQKEKLRCQFKKILYAVLPIHRVDRIIYIGKLSSATFSSFLSGQCLEAVILGTMFFVTMSIFRLPYALIIGVLISITALIPIFGAFLGLFIGTFLILMVNPILAIEFIIIFFVLQQIEGNLIYPHVVGGSVGLPSIWVLVAVTIGANLMGVAGMLIFIPLCSIGYTLIREYVHRRLSVKNVPSSKWKPANGDCENVEK